MGYIFSPYYFGIVHVFNIDWLVLNLVASDDQLNFIDGGKSEGVLYLLIFNIILYLYIAKTFYVFRDSA